jgi:hypothetical protein
MNRWSRLFAGSGWTGLRLGNASRDSSYARERTHPDILDALLRASEHSETAPETLIRIL